MPLPVRRSPLSPAPSSPLVAIVKALATRVPRGPALAGAGLVALALLGAGCGSSSGGSGGANGVDVVATTTQIGDWVREVGGQAVDVHQILQPNTDPHEYEPRPSDVEATAGAQIVFVNGDNLDKWMGDVVSEGGSDAEVVDLGAVVPERLPGESSGAEASRYDPHWWHDPRNAEAAVREIERRLVAADPSKRAEFQKNARLYLAKLKALDGRIAKCMDTVPASARRLVTDHDAFGYFADRYGIEVVGAVDPLADHPGPDLGQGAERTCADDRGRERQGGLPRELADPEGRRSDRRADRRLGRLHAVRGHARPGRFHRRHLSTDGGRQRQRDGQRLHRREGQMPGQPLIEAEGLAVGYGGPAAIVDVSFVLAPGQRLALLGPNGGGKTTLLRALLGELRPLAGRLEVHGRCGTVPQTERTRLDYPVSALDVATMGALSRLPWWRRPSRDDRHGAQAALERVGLGDRAEKTFGELSGGQRQRVLIARALVQEAAVLLLDEPFSGLDNASAAALETLIAELAGEGRGIVVATHDLDQARRSDSVLCLNRRQIGAGRPSEVLDRETLEATYGGAIVEIPGTGTKAILPSHHH